MNNRFSFDELRQAIQALIVVEENGDPAEWAMILRQASDSAPSAGRWGNATPGQKISGQLLADKLADLLGVDRDRCNQVAAEMFAPQKHRAVFDALLGYVAELTGQPSAKPTQRQAIRIVADKGDAA